MRVRGMLIAFLVTFVVSESDPCTGFVPPLISVVKLHRHHQQQHLLLSPKASVRNPTVWRRKAILLSTIDGASIAAAGTLLVSSGIGFYSDQKLVPNSGIVTTLVVSAMASNLIPKVPQNHRFYDICWSTILPTSLALLLLSLRRHKISPDHNHSSNDKNMDNKNITVIAIYRLAVPFLWASLGSIIGCCISFGICRSFPKLWLPPDSALLAASCLVASFIGGSVNFFATAAALAPMQPTTSSNTLLSAMASADILVMALYFSALASMLQLQRMKTWFQTANRVDDNNHLEQSAYNHSVTLVDDSNEDVVSDKIIAQSSLQATKQTAKSLGTDAVAAVSVSALALILVEMAKRLERRLFNFVPGTTCAFLATFIPALTKIMPVDRAPWVHMQRMAGPLSSISFLLLFAAIGASADLKTAFVVYGPACLFFSITALAVHGIVTLSGSWFYKRATGASYTYEDVLVASNAAIGGPATAAAFCQFILPKKSHHAEDFHKQGRTVAATVWGVVGYAIGTTAGVSLYHCLKSTLVV